MDRAEVADSFPEGLEGFATDEGEASGIADVVFRFRLASSLGKSLFVEASRSLAISVSKGGVGAYGVLTVSKLFCNAYFNSHRPDWQSKLPVM